MQVILNCPDKCTNKLNLDKLFNLCALFRSVLFYVCIMSGHAHAEASERERRLVSVDHIVEINLPDNAAIILLGNPEIADILNQSRTSVIVSGKKIGQTNLLVRDKHEALISDIEIFVNAPELKNITIFHGTKRSEFACTPTCAALSSEIMPKQNSGASEISGAKP